jgi:hypothetical protein
MGSMSEALESSSSIVLSLILLLAYAALLIYLWALSPVWVVLLTLGEIVCFVWYAILMLGE